MFTHDASDQNMHVYSLEVGCINPRFASVKNLDILGSRAVGLGDSSQTKITSQKLKSAFFKKSPKNTHHKMSYSRKTKQPMKKVGVVLDSSDSKLQFEPFWLTIA